MRILASVVLAVLFAVAFVTFFLADSLLRLVSDPETLARSARRAGAQATLVSLAEEHLAAELAGRPDLEGIPRLQLRSAIGGVLTEAWVEGQLAAVHGALLGAVAATDDPAIVELAPLKAALGEAVDDLERRARTQCRELFPPERCDDEEEIEIAAGSLRRLARAAVDEVPDRVDLLEGVGDGRRHDARVALADLRDVVGVSRTLRWVGLGLLVVLLALIVLVNLGSPARALGLAGATLVLASGLYLGGLVAAAGPIRRVAERELAAERARAELDPFDAAAAEGAGRLGVGLALDAGRRPAIPVALCGGGGLALLGLAVALARR